MNYIYALVLVCYSFAPIPSAEVEKPDLFIFSMEKG